MEILPKNHKDLAIDIFYTLPVGIVFLDQEGRFLSVNSAASALIGIQSEELVGKFLSEIGLALYKEDMSEFSFDEYPAIKALKTGLPVEKVIVGFNKPGSEQYTWLQVDAYPRFHEGEDFPYSSYAVIQDITDLYNSRSQLQQSEESYRILVDNMHSSMMILQEGIIRFGNKNLELKSGYSLNELIGTPFIDFVHPDDRKSVMENYMGRLKGKAVPDTYRSRTVLKDGSSLHVDVRVKAIRYQGKPAVMVVMNDIDAQIRSGEALLHREEHLRTIYDNVRNTIFELVPDNRDVFMLATVNEEFFRVTGYTYEQVIGKEVSEIFSGDEGRIIKENCRKAILERTTVQWEFTPVFPGGPLTGAVTITPIFDYNGKCLQLVGTLHDITERKKAEKKIIESESKFRTMFRENTAVMLLIDSKKLTVVDANDAALDFYGWEREEMLGKFLGEINILENNELRNQAANAVDIGKSHFIFKHCLKSGEIRDVEVFTTRIETEDQDNLYSIIFDVTDKKRYEEELKLFSTALEQSPESVILAGKDGLIQYVNPMFTSSTGFEKREVLGKNLRFYLEARNDLALYDKLWATVNSGKNWYGEMETVRKNGELIWENVSVSPICSSEGEINHFVIVRKNITEELRIRENLVIAKEKAEESDRLKSTFLATMSHELRTPLNAVLGFSDVIRDKTDDEDIARFADIIFKSGKGLLEIIEDIFDLARIERDKIIVRSHQLTVKELFTDACTILREDLRSNNKNELIKIIEAGDEHILERKITTDKNKVLQVLTNLIKNAVKYTDKGTIEVGLFETPAAELAFYVKDTGIGIPKEKQEVIFEFFRQGDDSHTRKYGGLGIGLAISNRIAHALSARIEIESEEGAGSVFKFVIPGLQADLQNGQQQASNLDIPDFSGKEVLAVEDDPTNMIYLEELISLTGAKCIRIFNGKEAIEYLELRNMPDVILMDLKMPVMDGFEATRIIKSRFNDMPVIALTAYAYKNDRERAIAAGCLEVIVKPINRQELFDALKKVFKG